MAEKAFAYGASRTLLHSLISVNRMLESLVPFLSWFSCDFVVQIFLKKQNHEPHEFTRKKSHEDLLVFFLASNPAFVLSLLYDFLRELSRHRVVMRELHVEGSARGRD